MAKVKLTKKENEKIAKEAKGLERELLIDYLIESNDENIINSLDEVLILVKLIMGEEVAKQVREHIKSRKTELLEEKERKREQKKYDKEKSIIERLRDYGSLKKDNHWDEWYDIKHKIFDIEIDKRWLRHDFNTIRTGKGEIDDLLEIMKKFKS